MVAKSSKAKGWQRAHLVFKPVHNDTLEAKKAQCPGPVRTLVYKYPVSPMTLNHMGIIVILILIPESV